LKNNACDSEVGVTLLVLDARAGFWDVGDESLVRGGGAVLKATRVSAPFAGAGGEAGLVSTVRTGTGAV
jgi:hypothetical protein